MKLDQLASFFRDKDYPFEWQQDRNREAKLLAAHGKSWFGTHTFVVIPDVHLGTQNDIFRDSDDNHVRRFERLITTLVELKQQIGDSFRAVQLGDFLDFWRVADFWLEPAGKFEQIRERYQGIFDAGRKLGLIHCIGNHDAALATLRPPQNTYDARIAYFDDGVLFFHGHDGESLFDIAVDGATEAAGLGIVDSIASIPLVGTIANRIQAVVDGSKQDPFSGGLASREREAFHGPTPFDMDAPWVVRENALQLGAAINGFERATRTWVRLAVVGHSHMPGIALSQVERDRIVPLIDAGSWTYGRSEILLIGEDGAGLATLFGDGAVRRTAPLRAIKAASSEPAPDVVAELAPEEEAELLKALAECRWCSHSAPTAAAPGYRLAAGGWLSPFTTGHWEVTQRAAERFGFSPAAIAVLRDASQDPDFYEWTLPAAHAQTPDSVAALQGADHAAAIDQAQNAFANWASDRMHAIETCLAAGELRNALYWLGYLVHGVEDLAPHAGRTNAEHSSNDPSPDEDGEAIDLAGAYAAELLRTVASRVGEPAFAALRGYSGEGALSKTEKIRLHGRGWDISVTELLKYRASATEWKRSGHNPVRWPRERVLAGVMAAVQSAPRFPETRTYPSGGALPPRFESIVPRSLEGRATAEWTVMVFMAGDDANPNGIEYAVQQDLNEIKWVGSSDSVHLLVQTDEARDRNSYRYRLRNGTSLQADRLEVFRGDVNTGKVSTLVDFVAWAKQNYPAKRYALVLWGHGSGHDDVDVYRTARGNVSPRVAHELAQKRLGFFGGTRRRLLENAGPARGFGYDSTAADFLDDVELQDALNKAKDVLGQQIDVLGFDACLMGMVEIALQVKGSARWLVVCPKSEPGDGWSYSDAFRLLQADATTAPKDFARQIVEAYKKSYNDLEPLCALDLEKVDALIDELKNIAQGIQPLAYFCARQAAGDFSPSGHDGYRQLGSFLRGLGQTGARAHELHDEIVIATCGGAEGPCVYLPGSYHPFDPGGTDELYERLDFANAAGWAQMLRNVHGVAVPPVKPMTTPLWQPGPVGYALDRFSAPAVLRDVTQPSRTGWLASLRRTVLGDLLDLFNHDAHDPSSDLRVMVVPGILGSTLCDVRGGVNLCWLDPVGLIAGDDFRTLQLASNGKRDSNTASEIHATALLPIVYDALTAGLMAAFGPVVEQMWFDWRRPMPYAAATIAARLEAVLRADPNLRIAIVAHSMGGLVASLAHHHLDPALAARIVGLWAIGTPWHGSFAPVQALQGELNTVQTFADLSRLTLPQILEVIHSFWGLTEMFPRGRSDLVAPALFGTGPFGKPSADCQRADASTFSAPPVPGKTVAIISTSETTVVDARVGGTNRLDLVHGPGDGTVPWESATAGGTLPTHSVSGKHSMLPLHGGVVRLVVEGIASTIGKRVAPDVCAALEAFRKFEGPGSLDRVRLLEAFTNGGAGVHVGDWLALSTLL